MLRPFSLKHTSHMKAVGLFKCVWPFSKHQALKGEKSVTIEV